MKGLKTFSFFFFISICWQLLCQLEITKKKKTENSNMFVVISLTLIETCVAKQIIRMSLFIRKNAQVHIYDTIYTNTHAVYSSRKYYTIYAYVYITLLLFAIATLAFFISQRWKEMKYTIYLPSPN